MLYHSLLLPKQANQHHHLQFGAGHPSTTNHPSIVLPLLISIKPPLLQRLKAAAPVANIISMPNSQPTPSPFSSSTPPPKPKLSRQLLRRSTECDGYPQKGHSDRHVNTLLKSTQVADQINTRLTIFAPTDNAFSNLPPGTLNPLTDQENVALIQFHVLSSVISISQFQTVSNPSGTQAQAGNATTMGNQVNISTVIVNTTASNTVYSDVQLAVYQVDRVLLSLDIVGASVAAPALAPVGAELQAERFAVQKIRCQCR